MKSFSDNGLLGGIVGGNAFNATFDTPSPTIIGLIVAIYEGKRSYLEACLQTSL